MKDKRIEASPEIEAILLSFAQKLNADAAILYKYIDEQDLEGTEILELISKSPAVVKNKNFYNTVINDDILKEYVSLENIVENYKTGTIDLEAEATEQLFELLKKHIKILRFCYIAEQDPNSTNWSFNYSQRPAKYLIFSDDILQDKYKEKQIPGEGTTAYFCRAKWKEQSGTPGNIPHWYMSRNNINATASHSNFSGDPHVYSNYDSHSAAWILLRNAENNVMGCLRFEYYQNAKLGSTEYGPLDIQCLLENISIPQINELFVSLITNVLKKRNNDSYENYYHCLEQLLFEVKRISLSLKKLQSTKRDEEARKEIEQLNSIHYLIEHLLYVLKRNTYHGDEILERVSCFISDLLKALGLHEKIFGEVWSSLRRHEDFMLYGIEKYRDHFMHQFHVFLSGYIIIYSYGIDYFQNLLNQLYGEHIINLSDQKTKKCLSFSKIDVLRVWALASLFHDCGYAFEKLGQGLEDFSNKVLNSILKSYFFWDDTIFNDEGNNISTEIEKICNYLTPCKMSSNLDRLSLFKILLQEGIKNNDHGVISAIILLQKYNRDSEGYNVPLINQLIYIASLAISMHNSNVFSKIKTQICIQKNPIMFLLSFCDLSQEWGRKRSDLGNNYNAIPHLQSFKVPLSDEADPKKKNTEIILYYPPGEQGQKPDTDIIKKTLNLAKDTFTSPIGNIFKISYNIRNSREDSFTIEFSNCAKSCT
jgi:hypothetical protein